MWRHKMNSVSKVLYKKHSGLNVFLRRPLILGNLCIPKKKYINTLKCVGPGASMSISHVLANCLEAAHYDSSMFPLALPACDYNVLTSWADQYRLKLVLNTDSLMIIKQFISTSIQK